MTARAPGGSDSGALLALYHTMLMARAIERRLWVLWPPPPHPWAGRSGREAARPGGGIPSFGSVGFEAVQVAAASSLRRGVDWVVPSPVDLALCLAMGMSPHDVMLAVFARSADPGSAGRQVPGAFGSKAARIVMTSGTAGRHVVHATGIAYASKVLGRDEVTLVCTDVRGTFAGDWHEGINFAGAHALPMICLVEDRSAGPPTIAEREDTPAARAEGYGVASETIDGGDFGASLAAFTRAVARARSKGGPTLVHARVATLSSRGAGGDMLPPEQLEAMARHDPIDRMRRRLLAAHVLDGASDEWAQRDCARVVEAVVAEASNAPSPEGPQALDNVYARKERRG